MAQASAAVILAMPACAQYGGPAILSRGEAPSSMSAPQIDFRPFVEMTGIYSTGLFGVGLNSTEGGDSSFGVSATWGVSGVHSWKKTKVGLDYRGSAYHFTRNSYFDGSEQSLRLGVTHQLTRHTALSLRESAGLFTRSFGLPGLAQTVPFDPSLSYIPTGDFFDNRTLYFSSQADFTWQKNSRLSFDIGGDAFLNRRRSTALYGVGGATARGDVQYRLTRRSTAGADYSFTHYSFHNVFSSTDIHTAVGTYAVQITRTLELSAYGGYTRAETKFLQAVPVDPAIAALIGRVTGIIIVHRVDGFPSFSGRLSRTFRRGVVYVSGGRSVTPGNGLFLTSAMTTAAAGYSYTGLRRWSFNSQVSYSKARSFGNVLGYYGNTAGTISTSRRIIQSLNLVGSFSAIQYQSPDFSKYNRLTYTARVGLGFTPGDFPLRLW